MNQLTLMNVKPENRLVLTVEHVIVISLVSSNLVSMNSEVSRNLRRRR